MEIQTFTCATGDVSGTVTSLRLSSVDHCLVVGGLKLTAQPTISGADATLAFADPDATVAGIVILLGR